MLNCKMDRIKSYQNIIKEALKTHASYRSSDMPDIDNQLIINEKGSQFVMIVSGWYRKEYIHNIVFHIEVKEEKVWIYEDLTDVGIANELIEKGIPESDIFLAYNQPYGSNYSRAKVA